VSSTPPVNAYSQYETPASYTSPSPSSTPSVGTSTNHQSVTAASQTISSYEQEYDTLQQYDAAELIAASFGSVNTSTSNLLDVLAQADQFQIEGYSGSIDTSA
jgi:hypothetical protein